MAAKFTTQTPIYKAPKDWHIWANTLKAKARQVNLWQYFEGKPWPKEPRYPEPKDFNEEEGADSETFTEDGGDDNEEIQRLQAEVDKLPPPPADGILDRNNADYPNLHGAALQRRRTRDQRLREELAEVARNRLVEIRNEETVLSAHGKERYNIAVARYNSMRKDYDRIQRDAAVILDWTDASVSHQYYHLFEDKELVERYLALETYSLPFAEEVIRETRRDYRDHMTAFKRSEKKIGEWITKWMHFMAEAQRYKLWEITTPEVWCEHLMERLNETQLGRAWLLGEFAAMEPQIKNGQIDYIKVAAKMQLRLAMETPTEKTAEKRRYQGAFPAYNGTNNNGTNNNNEVTNSEAVERGGHRVKRERSTPSRSQSARGRGQSHAFSGRSLQGRKTQGVEECELCSKNGHNLEDCYHTYPDDHPDLPAWWIRRCGPLEKKTVARLLKADASLAERVRQIKKNRTMS
ncbi:hypothetical protein B0T26DRAFT_671598 [Lasiosphaeria miniovina]|uniref:Gag protein n=1 Tax=Lasiosphaeria miniovina TaxID=1954250 RepID=A0AA40B394_9PEZI|nr:uncharacterized protein B0T26DRAFT_671598 [Lasiosphaeria miniovina]KAK0726854.1 hypothetical protein B0T26DRAFT_671598 [Lasiosphaeria miniovina]